MLVVGHAEREMVQPHGLPSGRLERGRRRQLRTRRRLAGLRQAVAVGDFEIPSHRILHMEALEPLAIVFAHRAQAAPPQFRLHHLGVPRLDDPAQARHRGRPLPGRLFEDRRAPVANVQHSLLAVIAAQLPSHQRDVERRLLLVVRHLEGDVVQRHGLPPRRREHRWDRSRGHLRSQGTRLRPVAIPTAALPECGCGQRRPDRRPSQGPQQLAARGRPAVVVVQQPG